MKKAARVITEKYYIRLGHDFHTNMHGDHHQAQQGALQQDRRLYHTPEEGDSGGLWGQESSIKLQEEERERRDNYTPKISALDQEIPTLRKC